MERIDLAKVEAVGEKFSLSTFLSARETCQSITVEIIAGLRAGMSESDGQALVKNTFAKYDIHKFWHPTKFRIAADTMKSFREAPDTSLTLQAGDICFLDLGPIIQDHEADFGRTFVFSQNSPIPPIINVAEDIFRETAKEWREQGSSGQELLAFASAAARRRGLELNPDMAGHRLGDFPHHIHSKQKLFDLPQSPSTNLWVLEIHVIDRVLGRGAFFEDILI